ncbi:MAG: hypothetical protein KDE63_09815 [Novosphingobium sp.]|nr:hypothetical protein [Novosphingobium sp.]
MSRDDSKPFVISQDDEGRFRLAVCSTRYNSRGYPIVTSQMQDETFETAAAAKSFARNNFNAKAGEYSVT